MGAVGGVAILGGNFEAATFPEDKVVQRSLTAGTQENSPIDAIILDALPLGAPGQLDSHAFLWKGHSNNGSPHTIDWKAFVNVTADDGTGSLWTLQTRIDGAPFTDILTVDDNGLLTVSGATFTMDQLIIDSDNTEAVLVRKDGDAGDVFIIDTINDVVRLGSDTTILTFGAASDVILERVSARVLQMNSDPGADSDNELRIVARDDASARYLSLFAAGTNQARVAAQRAGGGGRFDLELFTSSGSIEIFTDGVQRWTFGAGSGGFDFEISPFITDRYDIGRIDFAVRDIFTNRVFLGQDKVSGGFNAITIDHADLTGDANQDSGAILLTGKGFETATPHDIDWKFFVNVTADDGTGSLFTWQTQIDTAGFATRMTLGDAGELDIQGPVATDRFFFDAGTVIGSTAPGIWLGTVTPTQQNYAIRSLSGTQTRINADTTVRFFIDDSQEFASYSSIDGQWTFSQPVVHDLTNAAALTIRKNSGTGDVFLVDTVAPNIRFGPGETAPIEIIVLDSAVLVGDGQRDSHSILWTGKGFETATPHDIDWKAFVNVTADDGTGSIFTIQTRIDAAGYVTVFEVDDTGNLTIPGSFVVDGLIIDVDSTEAFLVRKDGDAQDIFIIDTINETVVVSGSTQTNFPPDTRTVLIDTAARKVTIFGTQAGFLLEGRTANPGFATQASFTNDTGGPDRGTSIELGITTFPMAAIGGAMGSGTSEGYLRLDSRIGNVLSEKVRIAPDGSTIHGLQLTSPIDAIALDSVDLVGDGQRDSHAILLTGKGFETATPHDIDWKFFVDVTADDGTGSIWTLQARIDGASFVDELTITATTSPTLMQVGPGSSGGAIAFGPNPASQGTLRLANADSIFFRNANNNGDLAVLSSPQSDEFDMFNTGTPRVTFKQVRSTFEKIVQVHTVGTNTSAFSVGSTLVVDTVTNNVRAQGTLQVGASSAVTGTIRLPNSGDIVWRNSGNNGDNILLSVGSSDEMILGESTTGPFIRVVPEMRHFESVVIPFTSTVALSVSQDNFANNLLTVDTTNGEIDIGSTIALPLVSVDRLRLIGPNLTVNGTAGGSHSILLQGKTRTSGGVNHSSDWRILVTPLSTNDFQGSSIIRFNGAIDGALGTETLRMEDNGRVAFPQPEQFSIGSPTFLDFVQVNITGSFIDDYGGGPTETHKLKIQGGQTADAGRTNRQTSVDVDTFIITQNNSETINEVGAMFIDAPALTVGTDTVNIAYTLKVNNYPTDGTENYGLLVDGNGPTANLTALVRIGKSGLQTGIKLLVGGSVGFDNLDDNAQMRLTGVYTADGTLDSAVLLHVHTTLSPPDGTTDHITGAFFEGSLRTPVDTLSVANISQVRIDEPNIQDNLSGGGVITNAQSLLITGAPTEGVSNFAFRILSGDSFLGGKVKIAVNDAEALFIQKAGGGGPGQDIFKVDTSASGFPPGNLVRVIGASFLQETASGRNTFGTSTAFDYVFLRIAPSQVISGGASDEAHILLVEGNIQGFSGDTARINVATFTGSVTSQNVAEAVANISQVQIDEPAINLQGSSTVTQAQSLLITGAPTEATRNYALNVEDGSVRFALPGPHVIGGVPQNLFAFAMVGNFTSGGSGIQAAALRVSTGLGGAPGDTLRLAGTDLASIITTQTASESIANVAQLILTEPAITDNLTGGGVITNAQTLLILGAPTEGVDNWAFRILSGDVEIGGDLIEFGAGGGNSRILFRGCGTYYVGNLDTPDELFIGIDAGSGNVTVASSVVSTDGNSWKFRNSAPNGQFMEVRQAFTTVLTSAGSSVTAAGAIPSGSFVVGITTRVITAVTGPTGFDVGDGIDVDRWGASIAATLNTTSDITDYTSSALNLFPASNDVVITSDGVDFTGGEIRITIHYMSLQAPSS